MYNSNPAEHFEMSHIYLRWPKAGYTSDETQHKSHKQIFIFRLTFFLILKLFECHCCNFRHTKTKTLPFPLGRRLRVMAMVRRLTKCFCFKCFLQLLLCERGEERDLLRERRVRFYFPLSVSGPTMNTKCWQNTNTTNANTQTHRKLKHKWNDVHANTKQLWKDSFSFSLKYKFLT